MRAPLLTLGLSALLVVGVVLGFVGLRTQRSDVEDSVPPPAVVTDIGLPDAPQPAGPTETVLMRVHAPGGRCWTATIAGRPLWEGCGSTEFALEVVNGSVLVHVERQPYGEGDVTAMIEVDGRVVQTTGPTSDKYPSFDIGYWVPETRSP